MAQNSRQSTPNTAETQESVGSTSLASPRQSPHDEAQCDPDLSISPTPTCPAELIATESATEQDPNTPQNPQSPTDLQQERIDCEGGVPGQGACNPPTVILIMGVGGTGKTSFIEKAIGHSNPDVLAHIRHSSHRYDQKFHINSFSGEIGGKQYLFLDPTGTGGLEDNDLHDMESLCQELSKMPDINGILYIQCMTDPRICRQRRQFLELFEAICGSSSMKNVVLLTSQWDMVSDRELAEVKEKDLRDNWWKTMIDAGATIERLELTPECVQSIVERFSRLPPTALAIKDDLFYQKKDFLDTPIWYMFLERIKKEQASFCPTLKHIDSLKTPEDVLDELYIVTLKYQQLQREHAKLLKELQGYKEKDVQPKSVWHMLGFGGQ